MATISSVYNDSDLQSDVAGVDSDIAIAKAAIQSDIAGVDSDIAIAKAAIQTDIASLNGDVIGNSIPVMASVSGTAVPANECSLEASDYTFDYTDINAAVTPQANVFPLSLGTDSMVEIFSFIGPGVWVPLSTTYDEIFLVEWDSGQTSGKRCRVRIYIDERVFDIVLSPGASYYIKGGRGIRVQSRLAVEIAVEQAAVSGSRVTVGRHLYSKDL